MKNNKKLPNILRHKRFFCIHKMYLVSAKGYENAGVNFLRVKKTGESWAKMKDIEDGLGVQNISNLALAEI